MLVQDKTDKLFREGKVEQAIARYKKAIADARPGDFPGPMNLWLNLSDRLVRAGRVDEARQELISLRDWATKENLPFARGKAADKMAELERRAGNNRVAASWSEIAVTAYDEGGFEEPAMKALITLARTIGRENPDKAVEVLRDAYQRADQNPKLSDKKISIDTTLSDIVFRRKKYSEASTYLARAARDLIAAGKTVGTGWADIHIRQAKLALIRGEEARADEEALKAIHAVDQAKLPATNKSGALIAVAMHLWSLGYHEASRDVAEHSAQIAEGSVFKNGVTEKAANNAPLAVQAAEYRIKHAKFESLLSNHEAAARAYARVLEILPENEGLDSGRTFIRLPTSVPYRTGALIGLAKAHIARGELKKAESFAQDALQLSTRIGTKFDMVEAEITLAEATRNKEVFTDAINRQAKSRKPGQQQATIKSLLRVARFHAASDSLKDKEAGLNIALLAIISLKSQTDRLEAAKLVLDLSDEIVSKGPPELKLKAAGLAETRKFYETRKSEILKRAERLSPVPWS
ncbi:hypothetical protein [Nisaea sp.]|uniref:hypothetical protein n=1 Tax=Nisaea sp. TaxID=2024842 RepID=UPI002B266B09|nr:hypothetical protein [Nisaea sp.]